MNIWTVIQARLGSTRLPRKVLMDIEGKTMLERVYERAERIGYPVALAVPTDAEELQRYAIDHGWTYCIGPEDDVLQRYWLAARALQADHIVRVTSDCPFVDPEAARWTVAEHLHGDNDLTTFHLAEGRGVQVFNQTALHCAADEAPAAYRHSPDVWMLYSPEYRVHEVRFSVDTETDLATARRRAKEEAAWQT